MPTEQPHTRVSFVTADNADRSKTVLVVWHYAQPDDRTRQQPASNRPARATTKTAQPEQNIAEVMDDLREGLEP